MTHPPSEDSNRRQFLGQLVVGAAALAGASTASALAETPVPAPPQQSDGIRAVSATAAPGVQPPDSPWDLSWTEKLTGAHRQVFDAPQIADGAVLHHARMFYVNYQEVYGLKDSDLRAVLVIRHQAIPMALGDAVWDRYDFIGKEAKLKDPTTGKWARRNPFLNAKADDKFSVVWADGSLDALIKRGAIVLACNMALMHFAQKIATRTKQQDDAVQAECKAALVPGATLVPSGIFGVIRAEEGGCNYLRATSMG